MSILVSIIVPCYKQAHFLNETLQSVLAQSFEKWECIIVNDGSPDNTEAVAKSWCAKDERFHYIYKDNAGLPAARNTGVKESRGNYILALDSDDILHLDYLQKLIPRLVKNSKIGIVTCYRSFFTNSVDNIVYEHKAHGSTYRDFMFENVLMPSSLYRKECWNEVGGYDETMIKGFEDWEFWISITKRGWNYEVVEEPLFFYRKAKESMLIDTLKNHRNEVFQYIMTKHREIYVKDYDNTVRYLFFLINLYRSSEVKYKFSLEYKLGKLLLKPYRLLQGLLTKK